MEAKWVKRTRAFSRTWFFLISLFLLIVIPLASLTIWVNWGLSPLDPNGKEKIFVVGRDEKISSIAQRLKAEGFIRDSTVFNLYLKLNCLKINFTNLTKFVQKNSESCLSNKIQAGSFKISPSMSVATLALSLTKGKLDSWLTIKEGLRNEEIADLVSKNYNVTKEDFLKIAKIGYMFPDTYLFKVNSTAEEIATKMRQTFDEKVTSQIKSAIESQGLTFEEGITLASIVERESKDTEERPIIAGILIKRLKEGWRLEVDATIQFALGYDSENKTWWRKNLTENDLNIDSSYNTRKNPGLPPGPISNPGLSSIKAVANPAASPYYYYLHDSKGLVHFAKTLEEHNANKDKYL